MDFDLMMCEKCGYLKITLHKNKTCPVCNSDTILINMDEYPNFSYEKENDHEKFVENYIGHKIDPDLRIKRILYNQNKKEQIKNTKSATFNIQCAYCKSSNVKKISTASKAGSVALFGIFSQKVHKQWHCNNCGSDF